MVCVCGYGGVVCMCGGGVVGGGVCVVWFVCVEGYVCVVGVGVCDVYVWRGGCVVHMEKSIAGFS